MTQKPLTGQQAQQPCGTQSLVAYAREKNRHTIETVNRVIDELHAQDAPINFEIVAKMAGVSRGTLYNNRELSERIRRLRAGGTDADCDILREKNRAQEKKLRDLRRQIRCLEEEKKKLIVQLLDHEELKQAMCEERFSNIFKKPPLSGFLKD